MTYDEERQWFIQRTHYKSGACPNECNDPRAGFCKHWDSHGSPCPCECHIPSAQERTLTKELDQLSEPPRPPPPKPPEPTKADDLWLEYLVEVTNATGQRIKVCGLCANTGTIHIERRFFDQSPAQLDAPCICPNGRSIKKAAAVHHTNHCQRPPPGLVVLTRSQPPRPMRRTPRRKTTPMTTDKELELEERLLKAIHNGQDTFAQLVPIVHPNLDFFVERLLRRMRRAGLIAYNRKRGCWELTYVGKSLVRILHKAERARAEAIEVAAKLVENHSCVSTCCDAQPGGQTAQALAACIRRRATKSRA